MFSKFGALVRARSSDRSGHRRRALLVAIPVAVLAPVVGLSTTAATAAPAAGPQSHYRATQVSWEATAGDTAAFELTASFRRSYFGDLQVGDTFDAGQF